MTSLRNRAISGVFWTLSQQVSVKLIGFIVQIILARLLLPKAFGFIAMLEIFITVGNSLMDCGISSSLVRTKDADQKDYSTVFFINLFNSLIIYAIIFFCAPLIATFYDMPLLSLLVRVYALSFIINALVGVHNARLTKFMSFKLQTFIQLPSVIIGGITGIVLAYSGYGVWSLVWMNLVQSFIFMVQHWVRTDWRPQFIIDIPRLKYHLNFGYKLTFIGLLNAIYDNIYSILIGKFFSATQLGFYNRARAFQYLPSKNLGMALQKVMYPTFSSIQNDNVKLKSLYKKVMQQALFWMAPLMITLCVIAKPLFSFVLTDKWLPAVPYFQILTVGGILFPLNQYNVNILWVKGNSGLMLKLGICKKAIFTIGIITTIPFGIIPMVIWQSVFSILSLFINGHYSGRYIQYPVKEQLKDMLPILLLSLFVGGIIWLINRNLTGMSDWGRILLICTTSGGLYLLLSRFLKITPFLFIKGILNEKLLHL